MITFKRHKTSLKIVPIGDHTIVQINGKPIAYLDDIKYRIVEMRSTSGSELDKLYYAANELGYTHKGYTSLTYDEKKNITHLLNELS